MYMRGLPCFVEPIRDIYDLDLIINGRSSGHAAVRSVIYGALVSLAVLRASAVCTSVLLRGSQAKFG